MTKRLLALAAPAAALAGVLLLGACGNQQPAAQSQPEVSTVAKPDPKPENPQSGNDKRPTGSGTGDGRGTPVDNPTGPKSKPGTKCGPVDETPSGRKYTVVADTTAEGVPGCTEVFNVLDEYRKAPADPAGGSQRNKKLSNGWSCATDGGSGSSAQGIIACTTGKPDGHGGVIGGRAFHIERVG